MRRIQFFVAVALVVGTVSGCGFDKRVWLCKKVLSMNNELCDLLSQAKDEASAKDVKPKLEVLKKRYDDDIKPEEEKLQNEKVKKEQLKEIIEVIKDDAQFVGMRFAAEHSRLQGSPAWAALGSVAPNKLFDLPLPKNVQGFDLDSFLPKQ